MTPRKSFLSSNGSQQIRSSIGSDVETKTRTYKSPRDRNAAAMVLSKSPYQSSSYISNIESRKIEKGVEQVSVPSARVKIRHTTATSIMSSNIKRTSTSLRNREFASSGSRATSLPSQVEDLQLKDTPTRQNVKGLTGLQNLGNTWYVLSYTPQFKQILTKCSFMNSCIQCLSNVPALAKYFRSKSHLEEINESSGTKGALARCEIVPKALVI